MKTVYFGFATNSSVVLWLTWCSWVAYTEGNKFNIILFIGLIALNLGVLCMQWTTYKIRKANDEMLKTQRESLEQLIASINSYLPAPETE